MVMAPPKRAASSTPAEEVRAEDGPTRLPTEPERQQSSTNLKGLVILDHDPGRFLFGAFQNVSILVWVAKADAAGMTRLVLATSKIAAEYPGGRSSVTVIGAGVPLPSDDDTQARLIQILRRSAGELACLAILTEGKGFARSARLSFHTKMQLASTGTYEMGFLDGIDELEQWLPKRHLKTGTAVDSSHLGDAVRQAIRAATAR